MRRGGGPGSVRDKRWKPFREFGDDRGCDQQHGRVRLRVRAGVLGLALRIRE